MTLDSITGCDDNAITQEGGRCFLVAATLVLAKSEKLRRMLAPRDLLFIERVFRTGGTNACPNPPTELGLRYSYFHQIDANCNHANARCMTSEAGGLSKTVAKAFLSQWKDHERTEMISRFHEFNATMHLSKLPTYMRTNRLLFNKWAHSHAVVILDVAMSKSTNGVRQPLTITKAFGRSLQRICSYNDNIVGGYIRCVRNATSAERKQSDKPNDWWTKQMMQDYIRTGNSSSEQWTLPHGPVDQIAVNGTKRELRERLQSAARYAGHAVEKFRHAVGFTVCHDQDTNTTGVGKPTLVICNWGSCYKGEAKTGDFLSNLLQKTPRYRIVSLTLFMA